MEIVRSNLRIANFTMVLPAGLHCTIQAESGGRSFRLPDDAAGRQLQLSGIAVQMQRDRLMLSPDSVNKDGSVRLIFDEPLPDDVQAGFFSVRDRKALVLPAGLREICLRYLRSSGIQAEYELPAADAPAAHPAAEMPDSDNAALYADLMDLQGRSAAVIGETEALRGQIDQLRSRIQEKEAELASLRADHAAMQTKAQDLDRLLAEAMAVHDVRSQTSAQEALESLYGDLHISESVLKQFRNSQGCSGNTPRSELLDRAAVLSADLRMLLRMLVDREQTAVDGSALSKQAS